MKETDTSPSVLTPEDLRKLQAVLLDMLMEVDRICKKNNIRYSLIGGTLLGAVRHGGFIPWDDDLDLSMMRKEYDRFREACKCDLNQEKYFFQDHTTDPYYRWGYGRIRHKNSEFVRTGQEHMKMKTGIFLDIFPGDNVPDFYPLRLLHSFYCFILRKALYAETGMKTGKTTLLRGWYALLYRIPAPFIFRRLDKLATRWNRKPAKLVRCLTFPALSKTHAFERRWYENLLDIAFEGHMFPALRDYDEYLTCKYGCYMELPPPEKRRWHPAAKLRLPED